MEFGLYSLFVISAVCLEIMLVGHVIKGFFKDIRKDLRILTKSVELLNSRVDKLEKIVKGK